MATGNPKDFPHGVVKQSPRSKGPGLRGRGGAGFPTGIKWTFMPKEGGGPRSISSGMRTNPNPGPARIARSCGTIRTKLVEGCLWPAAGMGGSAGYIFVRGEFVREGQALEHAVAEAYEAGYLEVNCCGSEMSFDLYVHRGAGAYICGEETALLEALEGVKGQPRLKPPFPATVGLYGRPTTINNVETIAVAPTILAVVVSGSPRLAGRTTRH